MPIGKNKFLQNIPFGRIAGYLKLNTSIRYKMGVIALFLKGIGTIIVGLHPTDLPGTVQILISVIHMEAAGTFVFLLPSASFLMAAYLCKHRKQ